LSDNAGGRFAINASSGVVTVANGTLLDYEANTSHSITVLATSSDGSTNSQTFTIGVSNVNDNPVSTVTDSNAVANSVAENASNGTQVGITAHATDADAGAVVTYTLSNNAGGRFAIDATTGAVAVANSTLLDYETATSHSITVLATSSDGSTNSQSFTIGVTNVNEAPVNTLPASFTTNEDTAFKLSGLSVSDVDAGSGTITVTLGVATGTLTAATAGSVTVSGSGTSSIMLSGTLANINTYLGTVANQPTYTPVANANGTVALTMLTNDGGNTGTGGALTDSDTININITAVNDAPVSALPASYTTNEDTAFKLSGLSVADVDAGAGTITVTLTAASGALTAGAAGGVTVSGSGTSSIMLSGTLANINTYLGTVANQPTYTPVANANGTVALTMLTNDGGNTGTGGALTDSDTININITAVNDAPVVTAGNAITIGKNTTTIISSTAAVSDVDSGDFNGGSLTVSTTGANTATDLTVRNQGTGSGQIGLSGSNVTYGGTTIGTFSGGTSGSNLVISFNASATPVAVTALLDNIQFRSGPSTAQDRTVTFAVNDGDGGTGSATATIHFTNPAGIAGEPIHLALTDPSADPTDVITINISGVPTGWTINGATQIADGTWVAVTTTPGALTVTTPDNYVGAAVLNVTEIWVNADGSTGTAFIGDNVEAYAPGSAIFALSSDDHLTGSSAADLFVFAQPITNDTIHSFDTGADKIDLIGFAGFATFADVQAHMVNDANGNAVLTLDNGETITVLGVDAAALNANNFVFNQEPVTVNSGTLTISDGAIMPFSGIIENTGTIALASTGTDTNLEILVHSVTLQGGGHVTLSDSSHNVLFGGTAEATLTNVDNIISGAGQLGNGQMALANAGTIIADGSNALVIDTGSHAVTNSGTLEASGSGGLVINSGLDNSGSLWANGGNITVHGDVAGTGSATISGTATLEFGGAANGHTSFADGGDGTLVLDHSATFTGAVSGFNAGDSLVFGDIFGSAATLVYSANAAGTGGTLILNDGAHTANITLNGQYTSAGFHDIVGQGDVNVVSYTAHAGDQLQYGTSGDDLISGGAGNDILIGGAGDDVLAGGLGNDTFDYNLLTDHGATGDVVTDFSKSGSNGTDVLDLHDLLQGFAGYDGTNAFTGGYLQFTAAGQDTVVQVDSTGGGDSFVTLVTLNNVLLVPSDTHNLFT
jgi:hypothetical protein